MNHPNMALTRRLVVKLFILGAIGLTAYSVDDWARKNTSSFLNLCEFLLLVLLLGAEIGEAFKGRLKALPDKPRMVTAIEIPLFQKTLAVYLLGLALVALFLVDGDSLYNYIDSPFTLWLLVAPLMIVGFLLEYLAGKAVLEY